MVARLPHEKLPGLLAAAKCLLDMTHNKTRKRENSTISVEDVGFFEGAEKLLEMWFSLQPRGHGDIKHGRSSKELERGLRIIPRYTRL